MDERRKGALKNYHQDLRTGLLVGNVLPALRPLLTDVEYSRVRDREDNVARVDELIDILLTKETRHFEGFCAALEGNGYDYWAKKIRDEISQGSVVICPPARRPVQFPVIVDLEDEFAELIGKVAEEVHFLSRKQLIGLKACLEEKLKTQRGPATIPCSAEDLMSIASKYWDFLDIEIAQLVVRYLGVENQELRMRMQTYETNLRERASDLLRHCRIKCIIPKKAPSCSKLAITMDVDPHSYSLHRILEMKDFLVYRIGMNIALFEGWSNGSIVLHFYIILEGDKEAAVHQLKEHELQLRDMQVAAIEVDGVPVFCKLSNVNIDVSINAIAECFSAGSRGTIVNTLEAYGQKVVHVSKQVVQTLEKVQDEVKSICQDSMKAVLEFACTFFELVVDVFCYCQSDQMAAAIEGLGRSPPNLQPLRHLLALLGGSLAKAEVKYLKFVGTYNTASHSCNNAVICRKQAETELSSLKKWGIRAAGGMFMASGAIALVTGVLTLPGHLLDSAYFLWL